MRHLKKTLFAASFLLLAMQGAFSGAETASADAVYLDVKDVYTLHDAGAVTHRHSQKVRILTHYAFNRLLGESFIVYNPKFQKLIIHESRTTMADGTVVDSTDNAFNEVLPGFCRNAPAYIHLREMVVTHLGLECGAVVSFDYEIRSAPGFFPFLMGEEVFGTTSPIRKKTVVVRLPRGEKVQTHLFNHKPLAPAEGHEGGFSTFTWTMENLPLFPGERMAEDIADFAPRLVFSTCPTWGEASALLKARFQAAACLDDAIAAEVDSRKEKAGDPLSLMRAIHRFAAADVAGLSIDPVLVGYAVRPAVATFHGSYGTRCDRAALLVAMLRHAGIDAEPVFLSQHRAFAEGVPSWLQFRDCRVLCSLDSGFTRPVVLDPARVIETVRDEGTAGRTILRPCSPEALLSPIAPSCRRVNTVKADVDLVLDAKKSLTGTVRLEVSGSLNPYFRLAEGFESWAKGCMKKLVPGAEFTDLRAVVLGEQRSVLVGRIKTPVPLKTRHGLIEYTVPGCPGGAMDLHVPLASRQERRTPLRLPRAVTEELNFTMKLPKNIEAALLPEGMEVVGLPGEARAEISLRDNVLEINRRMTLDPVVAPEEFAMVRQMLIEWSAPDSLRVMLKAGSGQ